MNLFVRRRFAGALGVLLVGGALLLVSRLLWLSLHDHAYYMGWALFAMVLFLACFNLRKKAPYLPLGSARQWLQWHIYVGYLAIIAFGLHIWPLPLNGLFELLLAGSFLIVAASGVLGLIVSRAFAKRLTARPGEVLWERIPRKRGMLQREAERLAFACQTETGSSAVPEFYLNRLRNFFAGPRNQFAHLLSSSRSLSQLLEEMKAERRYFTQAEQDCMDGMMQLVRAKDDLDYHTALQSVLKYWLFLHIPFTYVLLIFTITHIILVHAY